MAKIKWVGNKAWDSDFPEFSMPTKAVMLKRPDNIFRASIPYGILPLILSYVPIIVKWFVLDERAVNPIYIPLGILIGLLLIPVHELLHALCYPDKSIVYIGVSINKFAAFAVCHEPISKRRFIIMSLAPILLGVIPLAIFFIAPASSIISGICIPVGIIGMLSPMPDYMDIHLICKQVPKGATIQTSNQGFFWYI